jgi:hypothetical protein
VQKNQLQLGHKGSSCNQSLGYCAAGGSGIRADSDGSSSRLDLA